MRPASCARALAAPSGASTARGPARPQTTHHLAPCRATPPAGGDGPSTSGSSADKDVGLGLKTVWVGAEALGNVVGAAKAASGGPAAPQASSPPACPRAFTRAEALAAIRADYDENYFVSGAGDLAAYAPGCRFADPFAAFNGTERFRRNVGNLGGMLRDVQLDISRWEETPEGLTTKWRFSAVLDLPWRPRLAAAGGTRHVLDPGTNLVVEHVESWDVEPGAVVRSLLKPSAKIPTSNWDVLFNALHDGDAKGVWLASSGNVAKAAAAGLALSAFQSVVTGEGWAWWPVALAGLLLALVTEVLKISGGMQGGDTGTGGRF